jgi:hypothetical protein
MPRLGLREITRLPHPQIIHSQEFELAPQLAPEESTKEDFSWSTITKALQYCTHRKRAHYS